MKRLAALAAMKLSIYMDAEENQKLFQYYQGLLISGMTEQDLAGCQETPEYLFQDNPIAEQRYDLLYRLLKGNPVSLTAVQLYILTCMDIRTLQLLEQCFGIVAEGPTIQEAWAITHRKEECIDYISDAYEAFLLVKYLLLADLEEQNFLKAAFRPDPYLAAWLLGEPDMDYTLRGYCSLWQAENDPGKILTLRKEKEQAAAFLKKRGNRAVVYVSGAWGSGRKFFVCQAARSAGYSLLFVPYEKLVAEGCMAEDVWERALRQCLLGRISLCITDITLSKDGVQCVETIVQKIKQDYGFLELPLFLTGYPEVKPAFFLKDGGFSVFISNDAPKGDGCSASISDDTLKDSWCFVSISNDTLEEQEAFWNYFSKEYLKDSAYFPVKTLAARMNLTAGQIKCVVEQLAGKGYEKSWNIQDIFRVCYQILDDGRYQNMKLVPGKYTWEDLKIPPYAKRLLLELCNQAQYQITVLNQWGIGKKISYGRCVSALFSGPPGTGKTMAAQVAASHLGLDIYRVDLSQIMDKYIGETEKRLKEVFDQAEKSNMVLLFDEADALFSNRTDTGDAKEKHMNAQVSYLLQRIEEFTGIVLMTTNLVSHMDDAFFRRFRYHIQFQLPGKALRKELWEYMLEDVPKDGIDFAYLASQFELSGAQIKNISLNACYQAAAGKTELKMQHLIEAVFQEGKKEGKLMLPADFGVYGNLLDGLFQLMNQDTG